MEDENQDYIHPLKDLNELNERYLQTSTDKSINELHGCSE